MSNIQTKKCSKCNKEKYISEFYKIKRGKYGVRSICKLCSNSYIKIYRQENNKDIKKRRKKYRETHKKEIKEYNKTYKQEHKKETSKYNKKYRMENKINIANYQRERRKNDNIYKLSINILFIPL